MKKALITGALGQDGSYLAEHLLAMGYEVWGTVRRAVDDSMPHDYFVKNVHYTYADMRDEVSLNSVIRKLHPDEIYNLAGQVFVPISWDEPAETFDINTAGLGRILKIVDKVCPSCRVYQASSSEMFGNVLGLDSGFVVLNEDSMMNPVSPYGVSKYASHKLVDVYRKKGLYVVSGILFNHESPRRGREMVTRKITRAIAAWVVGDATPLRLGARDNKRDWGFAGDYVKAMHAMLQLDEPEDFVIGTGQAHSVGEFVSTAMDISGAQGVVKYNCPEFTRSNELRTLVADYGKASRKLGWRPEYSFSGLIQLMLESDIKQHATIKRGANV